MSFSFLPDAMIGDVTELTPQQLAKWGISALLIDLDNTLLPYSRNTPDEKLEKWLRALSSFPVVVVTNSRKPRVAEFCASFGLKYINNACKPSVRGIKRALAILGAAPEKTALAGDQVFTDILGANFAGLTSVLVKPLELRGYPLLRLRNLVEIPFIALAKLLGRDKV